MKSPELQAQERFAATVAWCRRHVPEEHPHLAASAAMTLRLRGRWPSPDEVRQRLRLLQRLNADQEALL